MLRAEDQLVRRVATSSGDIAYAAVGSGPPLLVGGWWCSHLTLNWADPLFRAYLGRLAEHFTVVRYDQPGRGASGPGRALTPLDLESEVEMISELVDLLQMERFALLGASSGAAVAAGLAAGIPRRVHRLVLYGAYARGTDIAPEAARRAMVDAIAAHWGLGSRLLADVFVPGASNIERERFARFQRQSATAEQAARSLTASYALDATEYLAALKVPTTVIHRRNDRAIPFTLGLDVARRVRNSVMVELPGDDHFPWRGDAAAVADATLAGLGHRVRVHPADLGRKAITDREREILELVAEGLTDIQIGERLMLSPHTVHRHVANARAKLGVRSRAAAAAALKDRRADHS
ncbi:alpha/beta fold hydrolase [Gordonia rhizosphera]|uniref:Putative hydrolase n=1 Tax=Gordonia rhizosphera NBRC 16068 TaxID=1108045 RepID=K6VMQ6_9ACTN|nr:alpha/beta fold hydrolase [Gordonia rhizosphera]GAB88185.1 putative hydrolase [Gordonia rhizosphera NBRC 16068]